MNAPTPVPADSLRAVSPVGPSAKFLRCLLVLATAVYFGCFALNPAMLPAVGVNYFGVWFLDSFAILASNDALARGLDVYAANPLDYLQRPHVYSQWWLELGNLGLTRVDNYWVGLSLAIGFLGVALAGLRPHSPCELLWYLVVICSSPVLLAIHRANNDLVIFVILAALPSCLLSPRKGARLLAVLLIALATGLKFYPAAASLLLLAGTAPATPRTVRAGLAAGGVAIAFVLVVLLPDVQRMGAMLPHVKAEGLMTFGAGNFLGALGITGWPALGIGVAVGLAITAIFWRRSLLTTATPGWIDPQVWLRFVLGGVLLTACFFTGMNFAYRWVFALWLAPFLWRAIREHPMLPVRRFAAITAALMLVALWADAFAAFVLTRLTRRVAGEDLVKWAERVFLIEQPFTWAFFACLIGWLVHFVRTELRILGHRR